MTLDQSCCRTDGGVVRLKRVQSLLLNIASEEQSLQHVKRLSDVVIAVEITVAEDTGEDVLGQDVLDQHLAHVSVGNAGVDGFPCLREESPRRGGERFIACIGAINALTQRLQNRRQIDLELLDGFTEIRDLRSLIAEEQL